MKVKLPIISIALIIFFSGMYCLNAPRSSFDSVKPGGIFFILGASSSSQAQKKYKIFQSSSVYPYNFNATGTEDRTVKADSLCTNDSIAKNNGISSAKAFIGSNNAAYGKRFLGTNWVLKASSDYTTINGAKLFTTTGSGSVTCGTVFDSAVGSGTTWVGLDSSCVNNEYSFTSSSSNCENWSFEPNSASIKGNAGNKNASLFFNDTTLATNWCSGNSHYIICVEQ